MPEPRIGLVIPALDEEEALPLVLADLPPDVLDIVVVVDNGSQDRTAEVAEEAGAFVVHEPYRGYGQACQSGVAALFGTHPDPELRLDPPFAGDDVVVFLDADHSDHPDELGDLLAPLRADRADLVIGSRVLGGATMEAMLPQAWYGNRLACLLMRLLFGLRATDLGPFRAIRARALRHLQMRDRDFGWTVEMQLKAHTAGLRVIEVPVSYSERVGESKITGTLAGSLHAGLKILGWIFAWRLSYVRSDRRIPRYR